MNPMMILAIGLVFLTIPYQIINGEVLSFMRIGRQRILRKTEPRKFWWNMVFQVIVLTFLLYYNLGYFD
jgi:hypothetical protein